MILKIVFCYFQSEKMPQCAAYGCKSGSRHNKGKKYSQHIFPKDEYFKKKWVENINRVDFQPSHHSVLCSKHFLPEWFLTGDENLDDQGRKRKRPFLSKKAVPTLHLQPQDDCDDYNSTDTTKDPLKTNDYGDHGYCAERSSPPQPLEEYLLTDIDKMELRIEDGDIIGNPWDVPDVSEFLK